MVGVEGGGQLDQYHLFGHHFCGPRYGPKYVVEDVK